MDFSMGSLAFWAIGFGIMFGATSTGWFATSGFFLSDFNVGGWAALAGTIVLGPRMGKYAKNGQVKPILGHNMALAAPGVFRIDPA